MEEEETNSQHIEIIPALPTLDIFLKVIEIPTLDVLYNSLHKDVVRRYRKMRRVEAPEFPPRNKPMDIGWKDIHFKSAENLTRLS